MGGAVTLQNPAPLGLAGRGRSQTRFAPANHRWTAWFPFNLNVIHSIKQPLSETQQIRHQRVHLSHTYHCYVHVIHTLARQNYRLISWRRRRIRALVFGQTAVRPHGIS